MLSDKLIFPLKKQKVDDNIFAGAVHQNIMPISYLPYKTFTIKANDKKSVTLNAENGNDPLDTRSEHNYASLKT